MNTTIDRRDDQVWPVFTTAARRPWRLAWMDSGEHVRRPPYENEYGVTIHRAFQFESAEDALEFARKNGLVVAFQEDGGEAVRDIEEAHNEYDNE